MGIRLPSVRSGVYISQVTRDDTPLSQLLHTLDTLPFYTAELGAVEGELKASPEDFEVEEIPAYELSGEGEHLYLWIEKRGLNTQDAVRALAEALGTSPDGAGVAGQKDRHAVTRQWISFHVPHTPDAASLAREGLRVLAVTRHGNKLRTGHLKGNRFRLRLVGTPPGQLPTAEAILARLGSEGLPNYFGAQRFGRAGDNLLRAYAWIAERGKPPGPPFLRKLFVSTLQSALFNAWLGARIEAGTLGHAVEGDVLRKEETGGLFVSSEPAVDDPRVVSWEISPTGPMFGASMRSAQGEAGGLELGTMERFGVNAAAFERVHKAGEGTRRVARVRPEGVEVGHDGSALTLAFTLPKGSYATVLVAELTKQRGLRLGDDA
jgi:tRNA pseudouridine13 synthase